MDGIREKLRNVRANSGGGAPNLGDLWAAAQAAQQQSGADADPDRPTQPHPAPPNPIHLNGDPAPVTPRFRFPALNRPAIRRPG